MAEMEDRWIDKHAMHTHRVGYLWKFKKDEMDKLVKADGATDKTRQDQTA